MTSKNLWRSNDSTRFNNESEYNTSTKENHDNFNLEKIKLFDIKENSVILEVYEKLDLDSGRTYYDIRCSKEYFPRDTRETKRGPYIHKRDLGDLIIAAINTERAIEKRIRELNKEKRGIK